MNDAALIRKLRPLEVPPPDPTARSRALHRACVALGQPDISRVTSRPPILWKIWATGVGLVICAVTFFALLPDEKPGDRTATSQRLLEELAASFPSRLDAVIERGGQVELALAESPRPASDQGVMLTVQDADSSIRVLSFSGRKVCLDLASRQICFEMLVTASGDVIVVGDDFVWTAAHPVRVAGHRIRAEAMARL